MRYKLGLLALKEQTWKVLLSTVVGLPVVVVLLAQRLDPVGLMNVH